ncbi:MAG: hypothetical protein MJ150_04810 [Clostridia bacterium]|nr:hypothetical protein [Clostridia bacterium]
MPSTSQDLVIVVVPDDFEGAIIREFDENNLPENMYKLKVKDMGQLAPSNRPRLHWYLTPYPETECDYVNGGNYCEVHDSRMHEYVHSNISIFPIHDDRHSNYRK